MIGNAQREQSIRSSATLLQVPTNDLSCLLDTLVAAVRPSSELRFNLCWACGDYLRNVPRRLGRNEALDAATGALMTAYPDYCSRQMSTRTLRQYSKAVSVLRSTLDNPDTARTAETVYAVMILSICHVSIPDHCT